MEFFNEILELLLKLQQKHFGTVHTKRWNELKPLTPTAKPLLFKTQLELD